MNYKDIYFSPNYGKLYEKAENGKAVCWTYNGKEGVVLHQFILRRIPILTEESWFDIVTPYGYGGPIIEKINDGHSKEELTDAFEKEFSKYCKENNIVSEFVRFHPILKNAYDFGNVYSPKCIRQTLGTSLEFEDPLLEEFSKGCRKNIRRTTSAGVSCRVTLAPKDISVFKDIYYATMDRNSATEYYYFDDEYFQKCLEFFGENLLLVEAMYNEKTISAGLYFVYNDIIHIHLSGTLTEFLKLSPAYLLRYSVMVWGKENGYKLIHHGGGKSNSRDDSLFLFKKQFAQKTEFDFYVGKKIWNELAYDALCKKVNVDKEEEYFPAYRTEK